MKVENREKNVESSAWLARLGAPRTAIQPCSKLENRERNVESSAWPACLGAPRTAIQPCVLI